MPRGRLPTATVVSTLPLRVSSTESVPSFSLVTKARYVGSAAADWSATRSMHNARAMCFICRLLELEVPSSLLACCQTKAVQVIAVDNPGHWRFAHQFPCFHEQQGLT